MRAYSADPRGILAGLWRHRFLIFSMATRDVHSRYRGSVAGIFWSFLNPILMLVIYTFVFSVIFNARWGSESDSRSEFAMVLFAGLILFNMFAECVTRAPSLIASHASYVKKVVFPIEILPWVLLGSALFHAGVSLVVWLAFSFAVFGLPPGSIVLVPLVFVPAILFTVGLSWLLASLGVYVRDTGHIVALVTTAMLFLSPILYPITMLPESWRVLLYLNPLTFAIEWQRGVLIWGTPPDWGWLAIYTGVASLIAWIGFSWFQKTRRGFADVI